MGAKKQPMKNRLHNHTLVERAQALRKEATPEERKLWYEFLQRIPYHFSRQKVIGNYIVDFYCASKKLVIELDGSQHYEDSGIAHDQVRDEYLKSLGLTVLRYSNIMIHREFETVKNDIWVHLGEEL